MSNKPLDIPAIERLLAEATPGPWEAWHGGSVKKGTGVVGVSVGAPSHCQIYRAPLEPECLPETHERQRADARLIAQAPTLLRALVERVRELEGILPEVACLLGCAEHPGDPLCKRCVLRWRVCKLLGWMP